MSHFFLGSHVRESGFTEFHYSLLLSGQRSERKKKKAGEFHMFPLPPPASRPRHGEAQEKMADRKKLQSGGSVKSGTSVQKCWAVVSALC